MKQEQRLGMVLGKGINYKKGKSRPARDKAVLPGDGGDGEGSW